MIRPSPFIVLVALAGLCSAPALHAQSLDAQRLAMRDALTAAEAGRFDAAASSSLVRHPLYGWLELAALRRDTDAITAALASFRVVFENTGVMVLWGAIVVALTLLALWPWGLGLLLLGPWLGHATWHAYRDAIGWDTPG